MKNGRRSPATPAPMEADPAFAPVADAFAFAKGPAE